ncbi:hypothetical protein D3C78_1507930 [compost metagenome]
MDTGAGLLVGARLGQFTLDRGFAGEVRVSIDQGQLGGVIGAQQDVAHALMQGFDLVDFLQLAEVVGLFGDPRRVLVDVGKGFDERAALQGRRLEGFESGHWAFSAL